MPMAYRCGSSASLATFRDVAERRSRESLHRLHAVDAAPAQAPGLAVGSRRAGRPPECWAAFDAVVNVTQDEYAGMAGDARYLQVPVAEGKRDKVGLVQHLPAALRFVAARLLKGDRVLVHCAQGRDRSVGVALAVLAACFDEELALDAERCAAVAAGGPVALDRGRGKVRLCRLLNVVVKARPRAEPSRATMKKLHRFFME